MLHEFIAMNREKIIWRCRAKVATRAVPSPTEAELAVEMNEPISTDDFRMLNRCLDDAIANRISPP
jgi:hypothetical protein